MVKFKLCFFFLIGYSKDFKEIMLSMYVIVRPSSGIWYTSNRVIRVFFYNILAHLSWKLKRFFSDCMSFVVRLSVCMFVRPSVSKIVHIFIFSRTTEPISTKLGTKHACVKRIKVCSNEGSYPFPEGIIPKQQKYIDDISNSSPEAQRQFLPNLTQKILGLRELKFI